MDLLIELKSIEQNHNLPLHEKEVGITNALNSYEYFQGDIGFLLLHLIRNLTPEELHKILDILQFYSSILHKIVESLSLEQLFNEKIWFLKPSCTNILLVAIQKGLKSQNISLPNSFISPISSFSIKLIASEDLSVAQNSVEILDNLIPYAPLDILTQFKSTLSSTRSNATVLLRYLSFVSKLSKKNEDLFELLQKLDLISEIIQLIHTDDLLVQINALDLLNDLSGSSYGLTYLCQSGTIEYLVKSLDSNPLLESEILRVLSTIFTQASLHSFSFIHQMSSPVIDIFLTTLLRHLEESFEESIKIAALSVLVHFFTISFSSLQIFIEWKRGSLLESFFSYLNSNKPELISAVLVGLASIFDQKEEQYCVNDQPLSVVTIAQEKEAKIQQIITWKQLLYQKIGDTKRTLTSHFLVKSMKQPFDSLRHASMDLLRALIAQDSPWALPKLFSFDPTGESELWFYLKERLTEHDKIGKEFKFSILQALHRSAGKSLLPEHIKSTLDIMVAQGPFYMPPKLADPEVI